MPTNDTWTGAINGDFDTAGNWSSNSVPNSNDDAIINTSAIQTITHNGGTDYVHSLTVGNDIFSMGGGSLSFLAGATFGFGYNQTGGTIGGAGTVAITGNGSLSGGGATGTLALQISGTIALSNYTLGGSVTLTNSSTINQTGQVYLGDSSGVNATITNSVGDTYSIAGDYGITLGATSAKLVNAGTFQKIAGNNTSSVNVSIADTGTISVASGTLEFEGPTNSFSGTISGAGEFAIGGGGSDMLAAGLTISTSSFSLFDGGTVVTLGGDLTYGGNFTQTTGATLNLNGHTLTLNGANDIFNQNFGTPTIYNGTLQTTAATTVSYAVLGGGGAWMNSGTVSATGTLTIGDSGSTAATFTNTSTGEYDLAGDFDIERGATALSSFVNGGILSKTAGNGTSFVDINVNDTKTISVASGILEFRGPTNNFGGAISGAGQFALGGSSVNTIAAATTITTSAFDIYDNATTVTLGGNLTYAGSFNQANASILNLNGHALTLSGTVDLFNSNFGTPVIDGSGTLTTTGTTTVATITLGGTVAWKNSGTVNETSTLVVGDSGSGAATFTNSGHYNFTDDSGITRGSATTSLFSNTGTLTKSAGNGTSAISVDLNSTGTISVVSGLIDLQGPNNTIGGTVSGAGSFAFDNGGTDTISANTTMTVGAFSIASGGTSVTLGGNLSYAKTFSQTNASTLSLNGFTLSLSGMASFFNSNFGTPTVTGSGVLATSGPTSVNIAVLGGTVNWSNSGVLTENGQLTIGDGSSSAATFTNAAAGKYIFVNDSGISRGSAIGSSFANAGAFTKTAGSGRTEIDTLFVNTGTVEVQSGTIYFANAVSGTGSMKIDAGKELEFGTAVAAGTTVSFGGNTGQLQIDDVTSFHGAVTNFVAGDEIGFGSQSISSISYAGSQVKVTLSNGSTGAFSLSTAATGLEATYNGSEYELFATNSTVALNSSTNLVAFSSGTNTVTANLNTFNQSDSLTGGTGVDTLSLSGGGSFNLNALSAFSLDAVRLANGASYTITAGDKDVAAGGLLTVNAGVLVGSASLNFNGSASHDGGAFKVTGGQGDDTMIGGSGNDSLVSGIGVDTLAGGAGNDTYYVSNSNDIVTEAVGGGSDTIITNVNYQIDAGSEIERLQAPSLTSTLAINLTGNSFAQTIVGDAAANVIDGGGGNDTLTGGGGADTFVFDTALNASTNVAKITDFTVGTDIFNLASSVFTALPTGTLAAADFTTGAPTTANQHILYNAATGALSYDSDGNGSAAAVQFATVSKNLSLTAASFHVV